MFKDQARESPVATEGDIECHQMAEPSAVRRYRSCGLLSSKAGGMSRFSLFSRCSGLPLTQLGTDKSESAVTGAGLTS